MMLIQTLFLTAAVIGFLDTYDNTSIVNVKIENKKQLEAMRAAGARSLACFDHEGQTPMLLDKTQIELAKRLHIEIDVVEHSVQKYLDGFEKKREEARSNGLGGWYSDFKTWNEVNERLELIHKSNPDITTMFTVGTTHEGRNIQGIRITAPGDASERKQVLWNGCQHAREWVAVMVPMYIAEQLVDGWYTSIEIASMLEQTEVVIVPIVNPDGYEFTYALGGDRFWRKNRRDNTGSCEGVDLNRNWGFDWNGGDSTSSNTCSDIYIGPSAFSEPEVQAMRNLVLSLPNLVAHIDYHSYSQLVLEPWASSNNTPPRVNIVRALSGEISDAIKDMHGQAYINGTGGDLLYLADGVFPDWTTDEGALSYTIELRPSGSPGFDLPPNEILPTCEENFSGAMAMLRFVNQSVSFTFPNGEPSFSSAGELTEFPINIYSIFGEQINENSATLHVRYGDVGPFAQRPIHHQLGSTYEVQLPASTCGLSSEYWFSVDLDNGETHRYPQGNEILYTGITTEFIGWDMESDPGWATSGLWEWGIPTGGGGEYGYQDPTGGSTGLRVYGYNLGGDYENNIPEQHITTTSIDISGTQSLQLQFSRYLNVEQPAYDNASISVSVDNEDNWSTVWSNGSGIEDNSWKTVSYDLSDFIYDSNTLKLRWTMGATDGGWRYSGWNIDDVQLFSPLDSGVLGDVNCDGTINITDLLSVVSNWGLCDGVCGADVIPDGEINVLDLLHVIGNW